MSNKFKAALLYVAAMMVLFYGGIVMINQNMASGDISALMLWAIVYGGLLLGYAHYNF